LTPTLVRLAPGPVRRVVGTLSQTQLTLHALGLEALDA
jgi:circadian clock protein KaiB